ncbi:MAG: serine hydrolase, partial [Candidatus Aminicenantes bacterium]|nr:serine hydrolase [Candidatus Aminicenantes bacterium]
SMTKTSLDIDQIMAMDDRANGHVGPRATVPDGIPVYVPMVPAGGVYSNIMDMAEYLKFYINGGRVGERQVLSEELLDEMCAVAFPEEGQKAGYGLGIGRSIVSRTFGYYHGGGGYGFISYMLMYPELKLGIVTLSNSETSHLQGSIIHDLIDPIIREELGDNPVPDWDTNPEHFTSLGSKEKTLQKLIGFYAGGVRIRVKEDVFGIQMGSEFYPLQMVVDENGRKSGAFGKYSVLRIEETPNEFLGPLLKTLNRYSGTVSWFDFLRLEKVGLKPGPNKSEWKRYFGAYGMLVWGRMKSGRIRVYVQNGWLMCNNEPCREHLPGLFFTSGGEALDFRGTVPTFRNILLIRTK